MNPNDDCPFSPAPAPTPNSIQDSLRTEAVASISDSLADLRAILEADLDQRLCNISTRNLIWLKGVLAAACHQLV